MQKRTLEIDSNERLTRDCYRLVLKGPRLPDICPGQFVHIEIPGKYLRRPISVCDADENGIVLLYKTVGEGTQVLSRMNAGEGLDVLMPLGSGFSTGGGRVLLIGGGLGAAPLHFLCRRLREAGAEVSAVLGFNTASDVVLTDAYRALGVEPLIVTLDGSAGLRGVVTDAPLPDADRFCTCGPLPMMRSVCESMDMPGEVSMEERMGCGAGFCYGCTIQTGSGPARVCADGPVFRKEEISW